MLQLLIACYALCILVLYMRLHPDAKKFVWNHLGRFCSFVILSALLGETARFARLQNQIMYDMPPRVSLLTYIPLTYIPLAVAFTYH